MIKKKCIDCGGDVSKVADRCWPCYKIYNKAVDKPKCLDCGKVITRQAKRCIHCSKMGGLSPSFGKNGELSPQWKGGRRVTPKGYVMLYKPDHPFHNPKNGYVMEHRLVMEQHLGRYLQPEEVVHHINHIKGDNRIENLKLFSSNGSHSAFHRTKQERKLSIILPIYNEELSINSEIEKIISVMNAQQINYEIIAVNDGSTDKTKTLLEEFKKYEFFRLVNNPYNLGYGASIMKGMRWASSEKICITDCDGSYPNEMIPVLYKYSHEYDMVVGARDINSEGVESIKRIPKKIINVLANFISPIHIPDLNSGLRIFDLKLANQYKNIFPQKFSLTSTITLAFATHGYTIKYVDIPYYKRVGKSKMRAKDFGMFIGLLYRIVLYFKPLRFFVPLGLFMMIAGFGWGVYHWIVHPTSGIGVVSAVAMMGGLQIFLMGFIADLLTKKR